MRSDPVDYSWRNHMPSLGPVDLAIAALTGLALSVAVVCGPPDAGTGQGGTKASGAAPAVNCGTRVASGPALGTPQHTRNAA